MIKENSEKMTTTKDTRDKTIITIPLTIYHHMVDKKDNASRKRFAVTVDEPIGCAIINKIVFSVHNGENSIWSKESTSAPFRIKSSARIGFQQKVGIRIIFKNRIRKDLITEHTFMITEQSTNGSTKVSAHFMGAPPDLEAELMKCKMARITRPSASSSANQPKKMTESFEGLFGKVLNAQQIKSKLDGKSPRPIPSHIKVEKDKNSKSPASKHSSPVHSSRHKSIEPAKRKEKKSNEKYTDPEKTERDRKEKKNDRHHRSKEEKYHLEKREKKRKSKSKSRERSTERRTQNTTLLSPIREDKTTILTSQRSTDIISPVPSTSSTSNGGSQPIAAPIASKNATNIPDWLGRPSESPIDKDVYSKLMEAAGLNPNDTPDEIRKKIETKSVPLGDIFSTGDSSPELSTGQKQTNITENDIEHSTESKISLMSPPPQRKRKLINEVTRDDDKKPKPLKMTIKPTTTVPSKEAQNEKIKTEESNKEESKDPIKNTKDATSDGEVQATPTDNVRSPSDAMSDYDSDTTNPSYENSITNVPVKCRSPPAPDPYSGEEYMKLLLVSKLANDPNVDYELTKDNIEFKLKRGAPPESQADVFKLKSIMLEEKMKKNSH